MDQTDIPAYMEDLSWVCYDGTLLTRTHQSTQKLRLGACVTELDTSI